MPAVVPLLFQSSRPLVPLRKYCIFVFVVHSCSVLVLDEPHYWPHYRRKKEALRYPRWKFEDKKKKPSRERPTHRTQESGCCSHEAPSPSLSLQLLCIMRVVAVKMSRKLGCKMGSQNRVRSDRIYKALNNRVFFVNN